jgi:tRNA A37 methylthiotransferase MiaB
MDLIPEVANQTENPLVKTAYVPIGTGCNQFCSYCIVPFARGLERYRSVDDILKEIKYWLNK